MPNAVHAGYTKCYICSRACRSLLTTQIVSAHQQCKLWRTCLEGERGSMGVAKLSACCSESALLIPADKQDLTQAASSTSFAVTKYTGKTSTFCQASTGFVQRMLYTFCCSLSCTWFVKPTKKHSQQHASYICTLFSCKACNVKR